MLKIQVETFLVQMLKILEGPVFEPLITIWALKKNYRIVEIAGDEPIRIGGEQKMRIIYNLFNDDIVNKYLESELNQEKTNLFSRFN